MKFMTLTTIRMEHRKTSCDLVTKSHIGHIFGHAARLCHES